MDFIFPPGFYFPSWILISRRIETVQPSYTNTIPYGLNLFDRQKFGYKNKDASILTFCAYTVLESDLFVVPDATRDPRFADTPLVTGARIRFYAGAPLIAPSGRVLGTLCIMDRIPRELTPLHMQTLRVLGKQIARELELRQFAIARGHELTECKRMKEALCLSGASRRSDLGGIGAGSRLDLLLYPATLSCHFILPQDMPCGPEMQENQVFAA